MNELVKVGVANEGEQTFPLSVVKEWQPTNLTYIGSAVFFKVEDTYFSMNTLDFRNIFES